MSYDDFCRLSFAEFSAVLDAYTAQRDADYMNTWEQTRIMGFLTIQPHLKSGTQLTPNKLLPFPWDKNTEEAPAETLTVEQQRRRLEELAASWGDKTI